MSAEEKVLVRPMVEADTAALRALAEEIWLDHYPDIIGRAQIEYMLEQRYSSDVLRAELGQAGLWWDLLLIDDVPKGYSSYFLEPQGAEMKLDKLYLHRSLRGLGYGRMMLERLLATARIHGCRKVALAVNKRNTDSIAAYRKWGFAVERAVVKEIGGGFVMDDYVMARSV